MRILISIILLMNTAFAECDFETIKKVKGGYLYSRECHIEVGKIHKEVSDFLNNLIAAGHLHMFVSSSFHLTPP